MHLMGMRMTAMLGEAPVVRLMGTCRAICAVDLGYGRWQSCDTLGLAERRFFLGAAVPGDRLDRLSAARYAFSDPETWPSG